ncbi:MAG: hypothetical protein DRI32_00425 [Chloroflexi bacterium]|nr:MAG: hypothetical protein DRI32_00425 [Chloroflexota bacterium]
MNDLEKAYKTLYAKRKSYKTLFDYYDGEQPLMYTNQRLREIFKNLDVYFAENWCAVVIDSTKDRVNLKEIQITKNKGAEKAWKEIWERSQLVLESDDVHEDAMIASESYVIAWTNGSGQMEAYANNPRMCHLFYDAEFPRVKKYGAKWWVDEDGFLRMTLYYPKRLEYYKSRKLFKNLDANFPKSLYKHKKDAPNKYGEVPVFHFRQSRRKSKSDLKDVLPLQNGINKLLNDMLVSAEFGAFKQRFIISNSETKGKLKNSPNEVWDIPAGDGIGQQTSVGQFEATALGNYLSAMEKLATTISSITRTPKHYFFSVGSNLSGEALIAMEAPLNKKARDRIDRYAPVWEELAIFMLKAEGHKVTRDDVAPVFDRPETIQPRTQAETRELNKRAGIALKSTLREEGKSEKEIQQYMDDIAEEKRKEADLAQAYLDQARKNFDQNGANE